MPHKPAHSVPHSDILYLLPYIQEELHPPYFTHNIVQNSGLSIDVSRFGSYPILLQYLAHEYGRNEAIEFKGGK